MNSQSMAPLAPTGQSATSNKPASAFPAGKSSDLWSQASGLVSLDSLGKGGNQNKPTVGPSMNSMKSNANASEWSSWANASNPSTNLGGFSQPMKPATANNQQQTKSSTNAFDDLLL
jgi:epsin